MEDKPDPRHAVAGELLRSSVLSLLNYSIGIPVGLLLVPFLLRSLGAEGYGLWTAANVLIGYTGMVQLGVVNATLKFVAEHDRRREDAEVSRVLSSALAIHLTIAAAIVLLWLGADRWLARWTLDARAAALPFSARVVWAALALYLARFPLLAYTGVISGVQRQDLVQAINLAVTLAFAAAAVLILRRGGGVLELVWASTAIAGLATLAYMFVAHRLRPGLVVSPALVTRESVDRVLGFGLRVWASTMSSNVHLTMDKTTLVSALGRTDLLGLYHIAQETVEKVQSIPLLVLSPLMAQVSGLHGSGEQGALQGLYRRAMRYDWIAAALMFGGAYTVGDAFIRVWLGAEQPYVVRCLFVLCIGWGASALSSPAAAYLYGMGFPGDGLGASFVGGALNIALALGIGLGIGPDWLAVGTTVALSVETAWLWERFHRRTGYPLRETFVPEVPRILGSAVLANLVASSLTAGASRANPLPLLAGGGVYCAVFALAIVLTGALDARDRATVERLLGRSAH